MFNDGNVVLLRWREEIDANCRHEIEHSFVSHLLDHLSVDAGALPLKFGYLHRDNYREAILYILRRDCFHNCTI